ncbi:hypothetical protein ABZZ74_46355 [Streptomyces sp. NPDC006476]
MGGGEGGGPAVQDRQPLANLGGGVFVNEASGQDGGEQVKNVG